MPRRLNFLLSPFVGTLLMATIVFYYAGLNLGLQDFGFAVLFPGLFAVSLAIDKTFSMFRRQETLLYFFFLLFTLCSVLIIDINMDLFEYSMFKILAAFMGAYIGISLGNRVNLENYFHLAFITALVVIIYFEYVLGTFNPATFYSPSVARDDFGYNANYYSYMSLFANFSILRLHLKHKNIFTLLGLIIIPLLGLAISFTTQSRSGLIFILLINAFFWFWVYKPKFQKPFYSFFRKVVLLSVALVFVFQLSEIYYKSDIQNRLSSSVSEDSRSHLAEKGLAVFLDHPIMGVGVGNFKRYSKAFTHNAYLEALAEHGILIGSLIIFVYILPFFKSFKLFTRDSSNPEYKLNLLFFTIFLLFNNIYVFYQASYAMMYFFLFLGIHYTLIEQEKFRSSNQALTPPGQVSLE